MKSKFEKFIISEIKKISEEKNINLHLNEDKQKLYECNCGCNSCNNKEEEKDEYSDFIKIEFETVNPEEFQEEAEEAKTLSEEMSRMKQLLNFNNPLLKF